MCAGDGRLDYGVDVVEKHMERGDGRKMKSFVAGMGGWVMGLMGRGKE